MFGRAEFDNPFGHVEAFDEIMRMAKNNTITAEAAE